VIKVDRFIFMVNFFRFSSERPFCYFSEETVGILRHFAVYPHIPKLKQLKYTEFTSLWNDQL
jgi:hypothetical protein